MADSWSYNIADEVILIKKTQTYAICEHLKNLMDCIVNNELGGEGKIHCNKCNKDIEIATFLYWWQTK